MNLFFDFLFQYSYFLLHGFKFMSKVVIKKIEAYLAVLHIVKILCRFKVDEVLHPHIQYLSYLLQLRVGQVNTIFDFAVIGLEDA